ncbi:MAG TPA: response regulator [Caulobacteraceae bacterium]|nr:response regulator [Caulobacteraceae bacterium]
MNQEHSGRVNGRILVVDDDKDVCGVICDLLDESGFAVVRAYDDRTAYETLKAQARTFSALVIDIDLGRGTTGFDVARYARTLVRDLPVIFLSGDDDGASVEKFGVSASGFIRKPFEPSELLALLRTKLAAADQRPRRGGP